MSRAKFKYGDRVKIENSSLKTNGWTGTVLGNYGSKSYWVSLNDGTRLCYKEINLKLLSEDNKEENNKMYITGDFNVVKVKFLNGTNTNVEYEYAIFEPYYEVGDTVVVQSAHHGMGVAKISALVNRDEAVTKKFEREVVAVVNMKPYEKRKQNRARLQELDNRMNQRVQELNKLAIFEMMAEKDESLKSMLEEYKELIG